MLNSLKSYILVALAFLFAIPTFAQNQYHTVGYVQGELLNPLAIGSSLALDSSNVNAFSYINPALLSRTKKVFATVAVASPNDVHYEKFDFGKESVSLGLRLHEKGVLGLSFNGFQHSEDFGDPSSELFYREHNYQLGYAYDNSERMSVGMAVNVYQEKTNFSSYSGVNINLGMLFKHKYKKLAGLTGVLSTSLNHLGSLAQPGEDDQVGMIDSSGQFQSYPRPPAYLPAHLSLAYQLNYKHNITGTVSANAFIGLKVNKSLVQLPGLKDEDGHYVYGADNSRGTLRSAIGSFTENYQTGDVFRLLQPTVELGYQVSFSNGISARVSGNWRQESRYIFLSYVSPSRLEIRKDYRMGFTASVSYKQFSLFYGQQQIVDNGFSFDFLMSSIGLSANF